MDLVKPQIFLRSTVNENPSEDSVSIGSAQLTYEISFEGLKKKQREHREEFPENVNLRVHRSISWIGRAETCTDDHDARFIFLWIAFNAAYADEREFQAIQTGERAAFLDFFGRLVIVDHSRRIYNAVWKQFSGPIRLLMDNPYIFSPFWQHHNGIDGYDDWETRFQTSSELFKKAFQDGNTARVLSLVFERLYVLRNQIVHGGSTWNSAVNRSQVRDGAAILTFLMPTFIDLMMDNHSSGWGRPFYPVVR